MYDELIKRLRRCEQFRCRECEYENLNGCRTTLNKEAADAIEKLDAIAQTYVETVHEIEDKRKWIPVTERLPEDYEQVLTCDERGNIHIFPHFRHFRYPFGIRPEDPRYFMPKWWMPLPQPPETEN